MDEIGATLDRLEQAIKGLQRNIWNLTQEAIKLNEQLAILIPRLTPPKSEPAEEAPPTPQIKFPSNTKGYTHGRQGDHLLGRSPDLPQHEG